MFKKSFLSVLISAFLFSSIIPSISFATETNNTKVEKQQAIDNEMSNQSQNILKVIENIPNSIIEQCPQKTAEWLQRKTEHYVSVNNKKNLIFSKTSPNKSKNICSFNTISYIGTVGIALVSNGISFTKILKINSALGGTTSAVSEFKKAYDSYRYNGSSRKDSLKEALISASSGLASDLTAALLDFFNLTNVIANGS